MLKLTPRDLKREANSEMVRELLSSRYLSFSVDEVVVRESSASETTQVECELDVRDQTGLGVSYKIKGTGAGVLDALFNGIADEMIPDCRTLKNLSRSRSILSASVDVVIETIQYFVNSEVAVLYLKELVEDSKKRNRFDLTDDYISKLSDLMSNTSYEDV